MDLNDLAIKYKADKWGKHHYTPVYYDLFNKHRHFVKKVLEIGTAEGASLFMWRDFFPKAMIFGAEIEQKRVDLFKGEYGMKVYKCNQNSWFDLIALLNHTGYDLDLIIDDGSHKPSDQIFTALTVVPLLTNGSIYVIEDVADDSIMKDLKKLKPKLLRVGDRYDDQLIIIKK